MNRQGLMPVYVRISKNGERINFASNLNIPQEGWDSKKQRAKGHNSLSVELNNYIDKIRGRLVEIKNSSQLTQNKLTLPLLKNILLGFNPGEKTLLELIKYHNEWAKDLVGIDLRIGTYKRYQVTEGKLKAFIKHRYGINDLLLSDIRSNFIKEFEYYLKTEDRNCQNTATKYLKILKKMMKVAVSNEWLAIDPFQTFRCTNTPTNRGYLSQEELETIEKKQFSSDRLEIVKDVFLFACYTGLSYSDVLKLTAKNIIEEDSKKMISVYRTKTNELCRIPLLSQASKILDKYANYPENAVKGKLLPIKSNQKLNDYLKEMADLCGISKKVTFHLGRHTFATTVTLANGISMEVVSKLLGHRNLRTTQIYAKMVDKRVQSEMTTLDDYLKSKNQAHENRNDN